LNTSLYISSGALQAYQQKIDTSANNVANVNTTGFKRKDQSFSEILASQLNNQGRSDQEVGRLTPNGLRVGYGTRTGLTQLVMEQGQATQTGNPFELNIQGQGFFQIRLPSQNPRKTYLQTFLIPLPPSPGPVRLAAPATSGYFSVSPH